MTRKAKSFEFVEYQANFGRDVLEFKYKITFEGEGNEEFVERLYLPLDSGPFDLTQGKHARMTESKILDKILQNLHLILGISYYKLYCPKEITIKSFTISKLQAAFWNTVYTKGLGEFFYKNKINFNGLVKFPYDENKKDEKPIPVELKNKALVAIGGGKDSIVTAEILKKNNVECTAFVLGNHEVQKNTISVLGMETIEIKRELDPKLFELNKTNEVYNGHIPISAIYAFVSLLAGILYDYKYLIFSNEKSANYGNVSYMGETINHQWSKSEEFESLFQKYIKQFVVPDVEYFSLLRPLYEIEVVRRFCELTKYHTIFSSCNRNFVQQAPSSFRTRGEKSQPVDMDGISHPNVLGFEMTKMTNDQSRWCGRCAKCAFVFCLLSAFLSKKQLIEIFGKNLYDDASLVKIYSQLLGLSEIKPFDCVGTPEETKVAMHMTYKKNEYKGSTIMKLFENEILPHMKNIDDLEKKVFAIYDSPNMPNLFKKML